jgi:alanine racemase
MLAQLRENDFITLNRIELSRERLLHNMAVVAGQHPGKAIIPVLKGNAYGHGLEQIAQMLNSVFCPLVAVDGYFEAAKIRDISRHRLLVMGYVLPQNAHLLDTERCSFVVQDVAGLHALGRLRRPVRVHMELNTGMNRLGLQPEEVQSYLDALGQYPTLTLEGIMTHLADADNEQDDGFTHRQAQAFEVQVAQIRGQGFNPAFVHIANTAGGTKVRSHITNALRLGIGLYGINPLSERDARYSHLSGLLPVLELKSTIIKVFDLQPGDKVSYNGTFTADRPMRIGVLPLGYYEGMPRELSNTGHVLGGHHTVPITGRVCMNHTMVDLTGTRLGPRDQVTLISNNLGAPNSVRALQQNHHLFPYTVLTGLSSSVKRVIV